MRRNLLTRLQLAVRKLLPMRLHLLSPESASNDLAKESPRGDLNKPPEEDNVYFGE